VKSRAVSVVIAIAIAGAPLVLDACLLSCHAPRAAASGGAPACHHSHAAGVRLRGVPVPCGHDHSDHASVIAAREQFSRSDRSMSTHLPSALLDGQSAGAIPAACFESTRIDRCCGRQSRDSFTIPLRI
jgi:hypothetical protein